MRHTPRQSITRWLAWFSGTLAVVAGMLIGLGPAGQEPTDVATVALNKAGGNGDGNEYILEDPLQCNYGVCVLSGSGSYMCMDKGAQKLSAEPPPPDTDTRDYAMEEYTNCFPEYRWFNNQNCEGVPDITDALCARNRWYYVDP